MSSLTKLSIDEIYLLAKQKMKQLGFEFFVIKHRNIKLTANAALTIIAPSEYWVLRQELFGIDIESDYGFSGEQKIDYSELINMHTGKIVITNRTIDSALIEFIQVLPTKK